MRLLGHRGSPGVPRFGENTRTSFLKALENGAAGIEFDVRRCGDGTIIVLHDATIDRTTDGSGSASSLTYPQISRYDAGHRDPIPRLADILDEFGPRCFLNIEVKETGLAREAAQMTLMRGLRDTVAISTFDDDDQTPESAGSWNELAAIALSIPTALLATPQKLARLGAEHFVNAARSRNARAIHPPKSAVTPHLIDLAHGANLAVRVWTVNDRDTARQCRDFGVDDLITDCPGTLLKALSS